MAASSLMNASQGCLPLMRGETAHEWGTVHEWERSFRRIAKARENRPFYSGWEVARKRKRRRAKE